MTRSCGRRLLSWPVAALLAIAALAAPDNLARCRAAAPATGIGTLNPFSPKHISLKDRLEKDLKARRPVEFAFIAKVVDLVEKGQLPLKLVDGTFLWARRRIRHRFQYFEFALRVRAARLGVKL